MKVIFLGAGLEADSKVIATHWYTGLTLIDALKAIKILGGKANRNGIPY